MRAPASATAAAADGQDPDAIAAAFDAYADAVGPALAGHWAAT